MRFTVEETNLMCIYGTETKNGLIAQLLEMQKQLQADEAELSALTQAVLEKLEAMSDEEFEAVKEELVADFE